MLRFREYAYNGSVYKNIGVNLDLDPSPSAINHTAQVYWRYSNAGTKVFPKCKYRYKRTIAYTLTGGCNRAKLEEIEYYALRNSKFKLDTSVGDWSKLKIADPKSDKNTIPYDNPWTGSPSYLTIYVVIDELTYSYDEGRDWINYTLKLKIVQDNDVV